MTASLRSGSTSPESIRLPTPTADDFPTPAGQIFNVTKRDQGLISPAQSSFSFPDEDHPAHAISTTPDLLYEKPISRHLGRGAPGDGALLSKTNGSPLQVELRKKRSQFYGDVFAYREPNLSPRDRIYKDSVITAEVKTNVIIKDEYDFLQDFSQQLSQRYQRPTSSIAITLNHSACLFYAGTFDSAYVLTISALPSQILPTTNKRNAALIQIFMADTLRIPATRGVIRFAGVAEEYLATNGTTILGQIENLEKTLAEDNSPKPSDLPFRNRTQSTPAGAERSPALTSLPVPAMPTEKSPLDRKAERVQKLGKRRSFLARFGK